MMTASGVVAGRAAATGKLLAEAVGDANNGRNRRRNDAIETRVKNVAEVIARNRGSWRRTRINAQKKAGKANWCTRKSLGIILKSSDLAPSFCTRCSHGSFKLAVAAVSVCKPNFGQANQRDHEHLSQSRRLILNMLLGWDLTEAKDPELYMLCSVLRDHFERLEAEDNDAAQLILTEAYTRIVASLPPAVPAPRAPSRTARQRMQSMIRILCVMAGVAFVWLMMTCVANGVMAWGGGVDCEMSDWEDSVACDKSCGTGRKKQQRFVKVDPQHGGTPCPQGVAHWTPCSTQECPIDCVTTQWAAGDCSVSCGGGQLTRTRSVETSPAFGGVACAAAYLPLPGETCNPPAGSVSTDETPSDAHKARFAKHFKTADTDKDVCQDLGELPVMIKACQDGENPEELEGDDPDEDDESPEAIMTELHANKDGKLSMEELNSSDEDIALAAECSCSPHECPVDCVLESWTDWGHCSNSCGDGTFARSRGVSVHTAHGGAACPSGQEHYDESHACFLVHCPVHGAWDEWSDWNTCSKSCGDGQQQRNRSRHPAQHGGNPVDGDVSESRSCIVKERPVHCEVGSWEDEGSCSKSCAGGTQNQKRAITTPFDLDYHALRSRLRGLSFDHGCEGCPVVGFGLGEVVDCRDGSKVWNRGVVTSLHPLQVQPYGQKSGTAALSHRFTHCRASPTTGAVNEAAKKAGEAKQTLDPLAGHLKLQPRTVPGPLSSALF